MSALGDLGSLEGLLQGLITITIGTIVSIKVFNINIRSGHTVLVRGDYNVVQFITHYLPRQHTLSFGLRCIALLLMLLCILFSWVPRVLVLQALVFCIPLILISFAGMVANMRNGQSGLHSLFYFSSTALISWFILANYEFMRDFCCRIVTYFKTDMV